MFKSVILVCFGFLLLIKGADFLVDGASSIAKKFHIPEIIIGLTIVSIGTSMPELFISITSALDGYSDMALGNVIGSNISNLLLILGISAILKSIEFKKETKLIEIPMCLCITIIFLFICNKGNNITRIEASALIVLFVLFIIYTIIRTLNANKVGNNEESDQKNDSKGIWNSIFYIILGIIGLKIGGDITVDNAVVIAKYFNLSEKVISLTILAIGTSLPELVTSVTSAIKGKSDIAIGNILGSNIFNMLLIIGVSAFIKPIIYSVSYNKDLYVLIISTIVLAIFTAIPPKNKMTRTNGIVYFSMYVIYIASLFY